MCCNPTRNTKGGIHVDPRGAGRDPTDRAGSSPNEPTRPKQPGVGQRRACEAVARGRRHPGPAAQTMGGSSQAEPDSLSLAAAEAADYCSATGARIVGIIGVHAWELGLYDERAQEEVWGDDQDTWIASTTCPPGR